MQSELWRGQSSPKKLCHCSWFRTLQLIIIWMTLKQLFDSLIFSSWGSRDHALAQPRFPPVLLSGFFFWPPWYISVYFVIPFFDKFWCVNWLASLINPLNKSLNVYLIFVCLFRDKGRMWVLRLIDTVSLSACLCSKPWRYKAIVLWQESSSLKVQVNS